jgi:3-oxoacyl-[acyl-carrier protein] reductase
LSSDERRTVLITGVAGEIGGYLARHFLERGWTVLGVDARPPAGEALPGTHVRQVDLTDGPAAALVLGNLTDAHGVADVLVNCAGRIANAPLVGFGAAGWTTHDFSLWQDVIASSLTTAFHATALTVKSMLEARRRGVIVNISSVCAAGSPGQVAYSAAKAGLNGLTLSLAKELGPAGIRVVGLAPGYFDTASTRDNTTPTRLAKVTGAVPLKRLGALGEIGSALDFIVANEYVNGTILELDGGLVI